MKKLVLLAVVALMSSSIFAQEVEKKESIQGQPSKDISALRLANSLVKYGYEHQSSISLITALQILSNMQTQKLEEPREGEPVDVTKKDGKGAVTFDIPAIIASAKEYADGDKNIISLVDELETELEGSSRGAVGGPKRNYDAVGAGCTDNYTISFIANRLAEILVSGDGDTDLDLYVYDSNGNLIVKDNDYTDDCYVSWYPKWTGKFYVKVVNRGGVYNRYVIATN